MFPGLVAGISVPPHRCIRYHHNSELLDNLLNICLTAHCSASNSITIFPSLLTLHHTTQRIQHGLRSKVLRGYQVYKVLLPPFFLLYDLPHGRIRILKAHRQRLCIALAVRLCMVSGTDSHAFCCASLFNVLAQRRVLHCGSRTRHRVLLA